MTSVIPLVDSPPLPFLPRSRAANVEVQDLDVTAPDLESLGNGVDAVESCNKPMIEWLLDEVKVDGETYDCYCQLQAVALPLKTAQLSLDRWTKLIYLKPKIPIPVG